MIGFCVLFSFGVAYIAYRGVTGTTGVNIAINIIQISALLIFSVIALGYRFNHGEGTVGYHARSRRQADSGGVGQRPRTASRSRTRRAGEYKVEQENGQAQAADAELQGPRHYPRARRHRQARWPEASHLPVPRDGRLGGCPALVQFYVHSGLHRHLDPGRFRVGHLDG